jgi:hypothetical protein
MSRLLQKSSRVNLCKGARRTWQARMSRAQAMHDIVALHRMQSTLLAIASSRYILPCTRALLPRARLLRCSTQVHRGFAWACLHAHNAEHPGEKTDSKSVCNRTGVEWRTFMPGWEGSSASRNCCGAASWTMCSHGAASSSTMHISLTRHWQRGHLCVMASPAGAALACRQWSGLRAVRASGSGGHWCAAAPQVATATHAVHRTCLTCDPASGRAQT